LVGKSDYFYERLKKMARKMAMEKIVFAGFVRDKDLPAVYREAESYVFPSLYEGFGLPPLEAMASGTPVISSDHPCMREILGEGAFYFSAYSEKQMAAAILEVSGNEKLKKELREKGLAQVNKYSWEKMARETLSLYQEK
jgi:glycosyltransferase involved in cell wall biosynthesis